MLRGFLIGTAALLVLLPASAATAAKTTPVQPPSGPVNSAQATVKVNGNGGTTGTATATCPKGQTPIAGGFNSPGSVRQSFLTIYASTRSGKRSWTVSAVINGFVTPPATQFKLNLTAYAYCRAGAALKQQITTGALPFQSNAGFLTVTAKCPKGTTALSGGFRIPTPTTTTAGWVHQSSQKNARSWSASVTAFDTLGTPQLPVTTIAYCAPGTTPVTTKKTTVPAPPSDTPPGAPAPTPGAPPTVAKSPKCSNMIAGGFRSPSVINTPIAGSSVPYIYESRRLGRGGPWQVSMFNPGNSPTTLTSTGYCG